LIVESSAPCRPSYLALPLPQALRLVAQSFATRFTQRQRERAILLAQVDKSREPAINNTLANSNCAAPATPSSVIKTCAW